MGSYVNVSGLRTYYETHGSGEPLVLLHGGLCTVESWELQTKVLSGHYEVYLPERRGHGRTPDVDGPLTYAAMAEDTVGFMDAIGLASAHLVGWSDGALVAALTALRRPEAVRKLVLIGQYYTAEGMRPQARALFDEPGELADALREPYAKVSPDGPEHFSVVLDKLLRLWRADPGLGLEDLARISAPTLVMQGDDDMVRVEHSAAVAAAVPDAQLAVVPGTSHVLPLEKPDLVNRLILDFLAPQQVPKFLSLGSTP
ncbi:alpha/beta fold hydrolase [Streptomyces sp. NPDC059740]|uniref:alpha/beta fold hydrolase n=1 Tax=Streptomyces sp. NPDC059740 TaxID=3346926 RepID=UPI00364C24B8